MVYKEIHYTKGLEPIVIAQQIIPAYPVAVQR